jgi:hypothetical protein
MGHGAIVARQRGRPEESYGLDNRRGLVGGIIRGNMHRVRSIARRAVVKDSLVFDEPADTMLARLITASGAFHGGPKAKSMLTRKK